MEAVCTCGRVFGRYGPPTPCSFRFDKLFLLQQGHGRILVAAGAAARDRFEEGEHGSAVKEAVTDTDLDPVGHPVRGHLADEFAREVLSDDRMNSS